MLTIKSRNRAETAGASKSAAGRAAPTVFAVDGDPLAAGSVEAVARMMNLACERYTSGRDFLAACDPCRLGCVVLDVQVPDVSGLEIQRQLAARGDPLPLIFVSTQATVSIAVQALRAGAIHFLQKPIREHELWFALEEAIELSRRRLELRDREASFRDRLERLTPAEWLLMTRLLAGQSNRGVAAELGIATRTIELRRTRLMKKLGVRSIAELVRAALVSADPLVPENSAPDRSHRLAAVLANLAGDSAPASLVHDPRIT